MLHGPIVRNESASQIAKLASSFFLQLHCNVHSLSKDISTKVYMFAGRCSSSELGQSIVNH